MNVCLYVPMRWNKTEATSTMLLAIATVATWSSIPFSDAVPQNVIGPMTLRLLLVLAVLYKIYLLVQCKANAEWCHAHYRDFSWDQQSEKHGLSNSTNSTTANLTTLRAPLLSALELLNDTHSTIIELCLTMLLSSLVSPKQLCEREIHHGRLVQRGKRTWSWQPRFSAVFREDWHGSCAVALKVWQVGHVASCGVRASEQHTEHCRSLFCWQYESVGGCQR